MWTISVSKTFWNWAQREELRLLLAATKHFCMSTMEETWESNRRDGLCEPWFSVSEVDFLETEVIIKFNPSLISLVVHRKNWPCLTNPSAFFQLPFNSCHSNHFFFRGKFVIHIHKLLSYPPHKHTKWNGESWGTQRNVRQSVNPLKYQGPRSIDKVLAQVIGMSKHLWHSKGLLSFS